jgi:hypothetical protein
MPLPVIGDPDSSSAAAAGWNRRPGPSSNPLPGGRFWRDDATRWAPRSPGTAFAAADLRVGADRRVAAVKNGIRPDVLIHRRQHS